MIYTIKNDRLSVNVSDFKAELHSIVSVKNGREYLWQGDEQFWRDRAIIPFPVCCRLTDNKYIYNGKTYEMRPHGFLQASTPAVVEKTDDSITLRLESNDELKAIYPFDFTLDVKYTLVDNAVKHEITVYNNGDGMMYFSTGGHPGINIPFCGGKFEDYYIEFPEAGDVKMVYLTDERFRTGEYVDFPLRDGKYLDMVHSLFDRDAIFLVGTGSKAILRNRNNANEAVIVDHSASNCPYLGMWHKPLTEAPYCCIEPFFGTPSLDGVVDDIAKKDDIVALSAGESFRLAFDIIIED